IGGGAGLVVGAAGLGVLNDLAGRLYSAPWIDGVTLDWRGVALTLAVTGVTAVAFGLVPALHASRLDVTRALAEGGTRAVAGGARGLARRALIVAEVALGVVLLVGAGLLLRTFLVLDRADPGFDAAPLVTAAASLEDARYAEVDAVVRLFDDSVRRLEALPGVTAAAVSLGLPYQRVLNMPFTVVGGADDDIKVANTTYVTPGYFDALGQPVLAGRPIGAEDAAAGAPVAVVNETFVRLFLDGRDPLATAVRLGDVERRIVGVTTDVQQAAGFMGYGPIDALPQVYLPVAQVSGGFLRQVHVWFAPAWIVKQATPGALTERAFVETMRAADPQLPMTAIRGIDDVRAEALGGQRLRMRLVGLLALVALLLTAIGIHGLIASGVTERLREIGIRLALGATTGEAIREVAAPGVRLALVGVAVGCVAAVGATRALHSLLWGVSETDTATYVVVAVTLVAVAVVASVGPALRIRRLDPMGLLRD
ncbi:MAG: ABC transporter permease, partial [Vicinamibacteria bacterium]